MPDDLQALEFRVVTPGSVAYRAFHRSPAFRAAVGGPVSTWESSRQDLRPAWEDAAAAVAAMPRPLVELLQQLVGGLEDMLKGKRGSERPYELIIALGCFRAGAKALGEHAEKLRRLRDEAPQG